MTKRWSMIAGALSLIGCTMAHGRPPPAERTEDDAGTIVIARDDAAIDAAVLDAGAPSRCEPGWTEEPGVCVRWRLAAPHPECWPEPVVPGLGVYGGPILKCGERGFRYEQVTDEWWEETPGTYEPEWFTEELAVCEPIDQTLATPTYEEPALFLLVRPYWSIEFDALLCDPWREPHRIDTLDPPITDISALMQIGGGILAAGPTQSAIYERRAIP